MAGRSLWRVFTLQRHARCTKLSGYQANVTAVRKIMLTTGIYASNSEDFKKLTPQDWQKKLTPEQYHVTREAGTEPPFSGSYYNHHEEGMYQCVCCEADLFSSATKFDSGSGWPSFYSGEDDNIESRQDTSHFMLRTEALCRQCKSHLGHVFPDGPPPTGLRYCINSLSLNFVPKTDS